MYSLFFRYELSNVLANTILTQCVSNHHFITIRKFAYPIAYEFILFIFYGYLLIDINHSKVDIFITEHLVILFYQDSRCFFNNYSPFDQRRNQDQLLVLKWMKVTIQR